MSHEVKTLDHRFELKSLDESGVFTGYGSVFNIEDDVEDVVRPGAFAASLASGAGVKMLRDHDRGRIIGKWLELREDARGLWVKGQLYTQLPAGAEAHFLMKEGELAGLSIGYTARQFTFDEETWKRTLVEVDLKEISVVAFPANAAATVQDVKSLSIDDARGLSSRDWESKLTRDAGLSRSTARALMRGGLDALRAERDAGGDERKTAQAVADFKQFLKGMRNAS